MPDRVQDLIDRLVDCCVITEDGKIIGYHSVPPLELTSDIIAYLQEQIDS